MVRPDAPSRFPRWVYGVGTEPDARFSLANERTFLAWVRTSLAFSAAGVALEALSLPLYILCAILPRDLRSQESGLKYFLLSSFASALPRTSLSPSTYFSFSLPRR